MKIMMFLLVLFFAGTLISMVVESVWYNQEDQDIAEDLTGYNMVQVESGGIWTLAKMSFGFLTTGLPKVLLWDYSFLSGSLLIFRVAAIIILSGAFIYELVKLFLPILQGIFGVVGRWV